MRLSLCAAVLTLAVVTAADDTHIILEKRDFLPARWKRSALIHPDSNINMRIALSQSNIDKAEEYLMDVSHPDSPNYGQHWTQKKILETFAPRNETVEAVSKWLVGAGVDFNQSRGRNWLEASVTIRQAESLLNTRYFEYTHDSGQTHVACMDYSVPASIKSHIDFITPTVHFDVDPSRIETRPVENIKTNSPNHVYKRRQLRDVFVDENISAHFNMTAELEQCDHYTTPNCLRALYQIPENFPAAKGNSFAIVQYSPQAYLQSDLNMFFANYSPSLVDKPPILDSIDGGFTQTKWKSFGFNGESDLDLEYAMSLVYPLNVTLYQVGGITDGASFNNFLDALDASYCSYDGGDDAHHDVIYPNAKSSYKGGADCGKYAPAKVISTSYNRDEAELTPSYERRQCHEYLKLGLAGTTFLYASGDYGVAGGAGICLLPNGSFTGKGATHGSFNPTFPGTCPYVLTVGATQVKPGVENISTTTRPEMAAASKIHSGGGFSNVFPLPSYQSAAVASYFKDNNPPYGSDRYNNSMATRGIPDVSANGVAYMVAYNGVLGLEHGTSASTPTFASILTLINNMRLEIGKSTVGFVNPVLYAHPEVLNDVVEGGNPGCGTAGFKAAKGWDPVTGLGTPNFPEMIALWTALP